MKLIILYLLTTTSALVLDLRDAGNYLQKYGYVTNNFLTNFETLLTSFQKRYKIQANGKLNNETVELMKRPRCIQQENNFVATSRWSKTHLRWSFPQAGNLHIKLTKKAFEVWERDSNFKFSHLNEIKQIKPDITISVQQKAHNFVHICQGNEMCPYEFDGFGVVLAHSYFPEENQCREIHFDGDEKWYFGIDKVPRGQSSFLMTLVHEIGHVLGLHHSNDNSSIMFPWYKDNLTFLSPDDKRAVEYLYGKQTKKSNKKKSTQITCSVNFVFNNKDFS